MAGIAYTSGTTITCAEAWFTAHPDDYGAVIHELCHVVQAYGRPGAPGWVTEGIADYVRWFVYEPAERHPRPNPDRAKYTDSYRTTGAFLNYVIQTHDKDLARKFNAALLGLDPATFSGAEGAANRCGVNIDAGRYTPAASICARQAGR